MLSDTGGKSVELNNKQDVCALLFKMNKQVMDHCLNQSEINKTNKYNLFNPRHLSKNYMKEFKAIKKLIIKRKMKNVYFNTSF